MDEHWQAEEKLSEKIGTNASIEFMRLPKRTERWAEVTGAGGGGFFVLYTTTATINSAGP